MEFTMECNECGTVHEIAIHDEESYAPMPKRYEALRISLAWLNGQAQLAAAVFEDLIAQTIIRGHSPDGDSTEKSEPVVRRGLANE